MFDLGGEYPSMSLALCVYIPIPFEDNTELHLANACLHVRYVLKLVAISSLCRYPTVSISEIHNLSSPAP